MLKPFSCFLLAAGLGCAGGHAGHSAAATNAPATTAEANTPMTNATPMQAVTITTSAAPAASMLPAMARPATRPRDPWVFRSVLDGHARMLTVALDDDLWLTYDTQSCALAKTWKGGVYFSGGVYDTRHGPQPKSVGTAYYSATQPSADQPKDTTPVLKVGSAAEIKPHYDGYQVSKNSVAILYHFALASGDMVRVVESPEYSAGAPAGLAGAADGAGTAHTLVRTFRVMGMPKDATFVVPLTGRRNAMQPRSGVKTGVEGKWQGPDFKLEVAGDADLDTYTLLETL